MVSLPIQSRVQTLVSTVSDLIANFPPVATVRQRLLERAAMRLEDDETADRYEVRAELPGIDPSNDIEVTVSDGWLTIKADRGQKSETVTRSEFAYGAVERSLPLPDGADPDHVTTAYDKGILAVSVPVSQTATEAEADAEEHIEADPDEPEEQEEQAQPDE